jgi:hypothetical protein
MVHSATPGSRASRIAYAQQTSSLPLRNRHTYTRGPRKLRRSEDTWWGGHTCQVLLKLACSACAITPSIGGLMLNSPDSNPLPEI